MDREGEKSLSLKDSWQFSPSKEGEKETQKESERGGKPERKQERRIKQYLRVQQWVGF